MGLRTRLVMILCLGMMPALARAASCTTQAELPAAERQALANVAGRLAQATMQQDYATLQNALLPAQAASWEGMRMAVEQLAPLFKGGTLALRNLYLLDAAALKGPTDTQFFCSNANGSLTVTVNMPMLPPGRYALVLADATGAPYAGQLAFVLVWDQGAWKLGGLTIRQGAFNGHDSLWYWRRARELTLDNQTWAAWYSYAAARFLALPVDFVSSPNLEKLDAEAARLKNSPAEIFPWTLTDGPRSWRVETIGLDPSLFEDDLAVGYESAGVTDSAAQRTEATAVMSALLKAQPTLRQHFHGLWAYVVKDGKRTAVMELPMAQIP